MGRRFGEPVIAERELLAKAHLQIEGSPMAEACTLPVAVPTDSQRLKRLPGSRRPRDSSECSLRGCIPVGSPGPDGLRPEGHARRAPEAFATR